MSVSCNLRVAVGIGTAITLFSTVMSGCSFLNSPKLVSNWTVQDARAFDDFPLYWLGDSYNGLPLTGVTHGKGTALETVGFVYGNSSCDDSGCSAPIWVTIHPYCDSPPQDVRSFVSSLAEAGFEISDIEIRGVRGYLTSVPRIYLWTGSSAIEVEGNAPDSAIEQAARDLIPIGQDFGTSEAPLPPPESGDC